MKVSELIKRLEEQNPNAEVEIECDRGDRHPYPLVTLEPWRFLGHNTVVLRTATHLKDKWKERGEIIDMEPIPPKLES